MKKIILSVCILGIAAFALGAQENSAVKAIVHHYAARNFFSGSISKADLDTIIQAGIHSPSAANRQPWHFTVVQDAALARQIISNNTDGNVLIVISAPGDGKTNGAQILDCGLAAQSMYLAAQALGLGSRIYTGPVDSVNKNLKSALSLPSNHNVVVIVRVGKVQQVDAVTAASARNSADKLVTYK